MTSDLVEEVNTTDSRIGDDEAIKMPVLRRRGSSAPSLRWNRATVYAAYDCGISVWLLSQGCKDEEAASSSQTANEVPPHPSIPLTFSVSLATFWLEAVEELEESKFPPIALSPLSPAPQCSSL